MRRAERLHHSHNRNYDSLEFPAPDGSRQCQVRANMSIFDITRTCEVIAVLRSRRHPVLETRYNTIGLRFKSAEDVITISCKRFELRQRIGNSDATYAW